jgi:hypothetical protein
MVLSSIPKRDRIWNGETKAFTRETQSALEKVEKKPCAAQMSVLYHTADRWAIYIG